MQAQPPNCIVVELEAQLHPCRQARTTYTRSHQRSDRLWGWIESLPGCTSCAKIVPRLSQTWLGIRRQSTQINYTHKQKQNASERASRLARTNVCLWEVQDGRKGVRERVRTSRARRSTRWSALFTVSRCTLSRVPQRFMLHACMKPDPTCTWK